MGGKLLPAEEAHHLEDTIEVGDEEDEVQNDVELGAEFDLLASEHGGNMRSGGRYGQGD